MYVAATRAKDRLYIYDAGRRDKVEPPEKSARVAAFEWMQRQGLAVPAVAEDLRGFATVGTPEEERAGHKDKGKFLKSEAKKEREWRSGLHPSSRFSPLPPPLSSSFYG